MLVCVRQNNKTRRMQCVNVESQPLSSVISCDSGSRLCVLCVFFHLASLTEVGELAGDEKHGSGSPGCVWLSEQVRRVLSKCLGSTGSAERGRELSACFRVSGLPRKDEPCCTHYLSLTHISVSVLWCHL